MRTYSKVSLASVSHREMDSAGRCTMIVLRSVSVTVGFAVLVVFRIVAVLEVGGSTTFLCTKALFVAVFFVEGTGSAADFVVVARVLVVLIVGGAGADAIFALDDARVDLVAM